MSSAGAAAPSTELKWQRLEAALNALSKKQSELYAVYFAFVIRNCYTTPQAVSSAAPPSPASGKPAQIAAANAAAAAALVPRIKTIQSTLKAVVHSACLWLSQIAIANPLAVAVTTTTEAGASATPTPTPTGSAFDDESWSLVVELERAGYPIETRALIEVLIQVIRLSLAVCESDARRERIQLSAIQSIFDLLCGGSGPSQHTPAVPPSPALAWLLTDIAFTAYTDAPAPASGDVKQLTAPAAAAATVPSVNSTDYHRFVDSVLARSCQILVNDSRLLSTTIVRIFERLSAWPANPVIADWIITCITACKRARRYGVLYSVCKAVLPSLLVQLIPPAVGTGTHSQFRRCWSAYRVLEFILYGYQSEPDAFHESIAILCTLTDSLLRSLPPVAAATSTVSTTQQASVTTNNRAQAVAPGVVDRARYLYRAGQLIQCLIFAHTGYATIYTPLHARLKLADRVLSVPPYNSIAMLLPTPPPPISAVAAGLVSSGGSGGSGFAITNSPQLTSSLTPSVASTATPLVAPFVMNEPAMEERLLSFKWLTATKQAAPFIEGQWQSTFFSDISFHVEEEMIGKQIRGQSTNASTAALAAVTASAQAAATAAAAGTAAPPVSATAVDSKNQNPNSGAGAVLDAFAYIPAGEEEYVLWGTYRNFDGDARKTQSTVFQARVDAGNQSFDGTFNYGDAAINSLVGLRADHYQHNDFAFTSSFKGLPDGERDAALQALASPKSGGQIADAKIDAKAAAEALAGGYDPRVLRNVVQGAWTEVEMAGGVPSDRGTGAVIAAGSMIICYGKRCCPVPVPVPIPAPVYGRCFCFLSVVLTHCSLRVGIRYVQAGFGICLMHRMKSV